MCGGNKHQQTPLTLPLSSTSEKRPFGLPIRSKQNTSISLESWKQIVEFIQNSESLWFARDEPAEGDLDISDPLLTPVPQYGGFMMCFDFHISQLNGCPKLIEVNTNAGGFVSAMFLAETESSCSKQELSIGTNCESKFLKAKFTQSFDCEVKLWFSSLSEDRRRSEGIDLEKPSLCLAIVDDNVEAQGLIKEMKIMAEILRSNLPYLKCCIVVSPEALELDPEQKFLRLKEDGERIHLIYNRTVDFRMREPSHHHIRQAAIAQSILLTPHPAIYCRTADKRLLSRLTRLVQQPHVDPRLADVVLPAKLMSEEPLDFWIQQKKNYVFKPVEGNGSRGVNRGDKISISRLSGLDPQQTIAQAMCPPALSADGSKWDLRVYTYGSHIIAAITRHFSGQVLEMSSPLSGFQYFLPERTCCIQNGVLVDVQSSCDCHSVVDQQDPSPSVCKCCSMIELLSFQKPFKTL